MKRIMYILTGLFIWYGFVENEKCFFTEPIFNDRISVQKMFLLFFFFFVSNRWCIVMLWEIEAEIENL